MSRLALPLVAIAILGSIIAIWYASESHNAQEPLGAPLNGDEFGTRSRPPATLERVTARMTHVVVGRYERIARVEDADVSQRAAELGAASRPVSFFEFVVEEYLVGEGPETILVAQYGDATKGQTLGMAIPVLGQTITLVTTPWSLDSSVTHPLYGDYGRLVERNGVVEYAFLDESTKEIPAYTEVPFAAGRSLEDLQEAFREAARQRGMVVPDR